MNSAWTEPLGIEITTLDCDNIQSSVDRAAADAFRGVEIRGRLRRFMASHCKLDRNFRGEG